MNTTGWRKKQIMMEQQEQSTPCGEPVAIVAEVHMSRYTIEWTNGPLPEGTKLYTTPPQNKPWRGLTDDEVRKASLNAGMQEHYMGFHSGFIRFADEISAILKEKNTNA